MRFDVEHTISAADLPVNAAVQDLPAQLSALHRATAQRHKTAFAIRCGAQAADGANVAAHLRHGNQLRRRG